MYVLVIEDDKIVNENICFLLRKEGIKCEMACTGNDALKLIQVYNYDLIVLDLILPDIHGLEVLKKIRADNITTPVLVLSGLSSPNTKVESLACGADDYIVKPYERSELVARIKAIVRRSKGLSKQAISLGNIQILMDKKEVFIKDSPLNLTSMEYELVELLALNKGKTLSKEFLLDQLYGGIDEPEIKVLDVFVCKIRKKIKKIDKESDYIKTVWGRGYTIELPSKN